MPCSTHMPACGMRGMLRLSWHGMCALQRAYTRVCKDLAAARVVAGALLEGEVDEEEEQQLREHRVRAV